MEPQPPHREAEAKIAGTGMETGAPAGSAREKTAGAAAAPDPLVEAARFVPGLDVSMRYATSNNFMKHAVYPSGARCLLRKSVAERLAVAAKVLAVQGYRLRVWDCYRPLSVQQAMWKLEPDPGYVADPATGSNHNRGTAVDLTLITKDGQPVEMPTDFDDFTEKAHHFDTSSSKTAQADRALLHRAMRQAGFFAIVHEWWHYNAPQAKTYEILDEPLVAGTEASLRRDPQTVARGQATPASKPAVHPGLGGR